MSDKYEIPTWKTGVECEKCDSVFNLTAIAWITNFIYYYTLICPNCGLSIKGKQKARRKYVPYWEEQRDMAIGRDLRVTANELVEKHSGKIGHVQTQLVVFVRCIAAMQRDWMGKCWYVRPPVSMIPFYAITMYHKGHYHEEFAQNLVDTDDGEYRYVIAVSDDAIRTTADPDEVTKAVLLHEMMHIRKDMSGIEKHNIMDFKELIDEYGTSYTQGYFKNSKPGSIEESS